ncbi:ADYC domain-containing protein [Pyxidicoccus trucidator]|uniref:ADYC domain-containing protein n=1 Tax=Pyxidicoccus trucidator TaxID=2709662 RepID=UPI0013DB9F4C|nr:ADYC domain-containing protein [Pyxidicoccus trucidator]
MNALKKSLFASVCVFLTAPASAANPPASSHGSKSTRDRYARRCQGLSAERGLIPQGTLLWGTKRSWDAAQKTDERRSVLVSVDSDHVREADANVKSVRPRGGRLVAWPDASRSLVGTVLQGTSGDGKPVEVAICGAEPAHEDPEVMWYRIEAWNPVAREWENPCLANGAVQDPRAMAVRGVWDSSGAHQDAPGKLTLACETGAISKCIYWGYKPWEQRNGQSLADLHQACTRMVRADYCGNGRSHTPEHTLIDMYDVLGVLSRMTESTAAWNTARASFEAAWAPDGASCLARTRDGQDMESILQECPGRFRTDAAVDFGDGDRCTVRRDGASTAVLRNRSYEHP